ncbi:MAG: DUF1929 domain-containing protein [Hyphomicrobium sp.]|nr:DUF1929 domain-containing protein [Hyphomicrobium sp.]
MAGTWSDVFAWPIVGIHAILTPDGKVLTYGTDTSGQQGGTLYFDVWDPTTNTHQTLQHGVSTDLFCSSCVIVPSTGEILIAGGDSRGLGARANNGVNDVNVFDYRTMTISQSETGDMAFARWYGTPVTLANGKNLQLGGVDGNGIGVGVPELYTPGTGWKTLFGAQTSVVASDWWYPRAWLASDGRVVLLQNANVAVMDPSGNGSVQIVETTPFAQWDTLPSIMFNKDKVLTLDIQGNAWVMDMSGPVPTFQMTSGLGQLRHWSNMTLLADGSVMVSGGSAVDNALEGVTNNVAIWNPTTGQWSQAEDAAVARLYHSTTLLLPDATVLSLGGGAPGPLINLNGEIFKPGYLFDENGNLAERPEILEAPTELAQGQDFRITVDDPAISRLTLVKFGAVTHSLNPEARMVELDFTQDGGRITVDLPDNANVVTPGYWMLFAFNAKGTPSVAATIQVGLGGEMYSDVARTFLTLNGSAAFDPALGAFKLTDEAPNQVAGVMSNARVDLSQDFAINFDAFLGGNDRGGEGLAFLLHNDPHGADAVGRGGSGFGAAGIRDGLGLEIDTLNNGSRAGDIRTDHANLFDTDAAARGGRITRAVNLGNVEDGGWHNVEFIWDADTRTLVTRFDGVTTSTLRSDIVQKYLGGSDYAFFGFTGATSGSANAQHVRVNSVQAVFEDTTHEKVPGPFNVADPLGHVTLSGNASYMGSSDVFRLTADLTNVSGNIMSNERILLTHDFSISFNIFLGRNDRGADGMAFVLHNDPAGAEANGGRGGALGAAGIRNGLAIEFDTFNNGAAAGDIRTDHASFVDTDGGFLPLSRVVNLRNVEDGRWHRVDVTWDVDTQTMSFTFDGKRSLTSSISGDLADTYFGGSDSVHFGWTAATGGISNPQMVRVTAVNAVFDPDPVQTSLYQPNVYHDQL